MNLLFVCTLSLTVAHNIFCADAQELQEKINRVIASSNKMTPTKFFSEYCDTDTQNMVFQYSKELSEDLYQKALAGNYDAMWQLAQEADDPYHINTTIPMYWLSRISAQIEKTPQSSDEIKLKNRAEEKLDAITQCARLLHIKAQDKIESKKRKEQRDRLNALLVELDIQKRQLDTAQTWHAGLKEFNS
jgi:hypothetical protein